MVGKVSVEQWSTARKCKEGPVENTMVRIAVATVVVVVDFLPRFFADVFG